MLNIHENDTLAFFFIFFFPSILSIFLIIAFKLYDLTEKMTRFIKKSTSSSSSRGFQGQGRVLGSSSKSSGPTNITSSRILDRNPIHPRPTPAVDPNSNTHSPLIKNCNSGEQPDNLVSNQEHCNRNGHSLTDNVSDHIENSLADSEGVYKNVVGEVKMDPNSDLEASVSRYVLGMPSRGSLDIVLKLLRNVVTEPENVKFRKVRLGNVMIKEFIVDVTGGLDLVKYAGFSLKEEGGEMWAVMDVPTKEQIDMIKKALLLLESWNVDLHTRAKDKINGSVEQKKVDRQIRVFSASENRAVRTELPDSFYTLSPDEVKREANARQKKVAESQLLVPKSLKEKQEKAARKKYTETVIRVQFPDGVILQGVFSPREPTTTLYEFVRSALEEPGLEFNLMHPIVVTKRVIPRLAAAGARTRTLEDEGLIPNAKIRFVLLDRNSVFSGLSSDYLQIMEPFVSDS